MHAAVRVSGWSLLIAALLGLAYPERPDLPLAEAFDFPLEAATYEPPERQAPPPSGPGPCPTPTCFMRGLPNLLR